MPDQHTVHHKISTGERLFEKLPGLVGGTFFTTILALSALFFIAIDFDCFRSIVLIAPGFISFKVSAACFKSFLLVWRNTWNISSTYPVYEMFIKKIF